MVKRFKNNPLLCPSDIEPSMPDMEVACLLNPGVFRYEDKIWLVLRVAERPKQEEGKISFPVYNDKGKIEILSFQKDDTDLDAHDSRVIRYKGSDYLTTLSHLRLVCSEDGIHFMEPEGYSSIMGQGPLESFGIEDCRVATFDDFYALTFTEVSRYGVGVGLIITQNWKDYQREGMIFPPHNKDSAIFEQKIDGIYYAFHRPSSPELGGNYLWIAESPDLIHWGKHRCIATTRERMWDSARIGAGASPILTPEGWLEIYHGANEKNEYCLGVILLDKKYPWKVLARSQEPIMQPEMEYELKGFFGHVIFTNGHLVEGDTIKMYYGASDEVICGATLSISEIMNTLK